MSSQLSVDWFHLAVRTDSDNVRMTSKRGQNKTGHRRVARLQNHPLTSYTRNGKWNLKITLNWISKWPVVSSLPDVHVGGNEGAIQFF